MILSASTTHAGLQRLSQLRANTFHPIEIGSMNIIPHLETVAGLACAKSITSKIIDIFEFMVMISPDVRQSFLLSSSTVFLEF